MKLSFILFFGATAVKSEPFISVKHNVPFIGVPRGGASHIPTDSVVMYHTPNITAEDYARAQRAIYHAAERAEEALRHAVEQEVTTLFHNNSDDEHHHKEQIKSKAKQAVQQGAKKVKQKVKDHASSSDEDRHLPFEGDYPYPYDLPSVLAKEHKEHRILHAIESAEKAVLHAVEEEVASLFHELEHHEDHAEVTKKTKSKAKKAVKKGVDKSHKAVKEHSDQRRKNAQEDGGFSFIEEYIELSAFE